MSKFSLFWRALRCNMLGQIGIRILGVSLNSNLGILSLKLQINCVRTGPGPIILISTLYNKRLGETAEKYRVVVCLLVHLYRDQVHKMRQLEWKLGRTKPWSCSSSRSQTGKTELKSFLRSRASFFPTKCCRIYMFFTSRIFTHSCSAVFQGQ